MVAQFTRDRLASPDGLLAALRGLCPDFGDEELVAEVDSGEANLHTIMLAFASSFRAATTTPQQLADLALLMSQCVAETGDLENAVGTCFLEHLHQIDRRGVLWECLPPDVKDYVRTH